jgi:hypothetical protein
MLHRITASATTDRRRVQAVRAGPPLGATVVARHYTPRSAIVGSVLLCDTLDLDSSVGISNSVLLCRDVIRSGAIHNSIIITPGEFALTDLAANTVVLTGETPSRKVRYSSCVVGSLQEMDTKKLNHDTEAVFLASKETPRYWTPLSSTVVGVVAQDGESRVMVESPAEKMTGLKKGDVILEVNGHPIRSRGGLEAVIPHPRLRDTYVTLLRDRIPLVVKVAPTR